MDRAEKAGKQVVEVISFSTVVVVTRVVLSGIVLITMVERGFRTATTG